MNNVNLDAGGGRRRRRAAPFLVVILSRGIDRADATSRRARLRSCTVLFVRSRRAQESSIVVRESRASAGCSNCQLSTCRHASNQTRENSGSARREEARAFTPALAAPFAPRLASSRSRATARWHPGGTAPPARRPLRDLLPRRLRRAPDRGGRVQGREGDVPRERAVQHPGDVRDGDRQLRRAAVRRRPQRRARVPARRSRGVRSLPSRLARAEAPGPRRVRRRRRPRRLRLHAQSVPRAAGGRGRGDDPRQRRGDARHHGRRLGRSGAFIFLHWSRYDDVRVVHADP